MMKIVHVTSAQDLSLRKRRSRIMLEHINQLYADDVSVNQEYALMHNLGKEIATFAQLIPQTGTEAKREAAIKRELDKHSWHVTIFYRFYSLPSVPSNTVLSSQQINVFSGIIDRTPVASKEVRPIYRLVLDEKTYDDDGSFDFDPGVSHAKNKTTVPKRGRATKKASDLLQTIRSTPEGLIIDAKAYDEMLKRDSYWTRFCDAILVSGNIYIV